MRPDPWPLLRRLAGRSPAGAADPPADADLLARWARAGDQAAFELLVWRHGALVLGVCRRTLRDAHAAEDAFQAVFLILARKAGSVRAGTSAAGWLHRVARRVAVRAAKRQAARTRHEERLAGDPPGRHPPPPDPDLKAVVDAEVDRLPNRLRLPVVLCYLEGRSTEDAARLLGVPRGTVLSRLAAARGTLAGRLARRGITAPAGGLAGAGLSAEQVEACVAGAARFLAGAGGPAGSIQLATEVLRMGAWKKAAGWAAVLLTTAGLGTWGAVVSGGQGAPGGTAEAEPKAPARPAAPPGPAAAADPARLTRAVEEVSKRLACLKSEAWEISQGADLDFDLEVLDSERRLLADALIRARQEAAGPSPEEIEAERALTEARRAVVPKELIEAAVLASPEVNALQTAIRKHQAESGGRKDEKFADLDRRLGEVARKVRAEAPEYLRLPEITRAADRLGAAERRRLEDIRRFRDVEERLARVARQRRELAARRDALQPVADQLRHLTQLRARLELMRLAEAVDMPQLAGPTAEPGADKADAVLAELARLRADIRRLMDQRAADPAAK